jgi:hypothetical protein
MCPVYFVTYVPGLHHQRELKRRNSARWAIEFIRTNGAQEK